MKALHRASLLNQQMTNWLERRLPRPVFQSLQRMEKYTVPIVAIAAAGVVIVAMLSWELYQRTH